MMHQSLSQLVAHVKKFHQAPKHCLNHHSSLHLRGHCKDGALTSTQGNYKYAVVAVEYFRKWIDVKPLVNIAAAGLRRFFWQNIICRFGVTRKITVNNAKQFDCHIFKDFCYQMGGSKQPSHQCIILNLMV
jgi:hypothetical protein